MTTTHATPQNAPTRRQALAAGGLVALAAACAPSATPAAPAGAPAAGAARQAWEKEWDDLVAAAKAEGKLSVLTLVGAGYRKSLDQFEAAFPGISVDHQTFPSASLYAPRIQEERKAGVYSFDAALVSPGSPIRVLKPQGVWDPIRPLLFRPDVTSDASWIHPVEQCYIDLERRLAFAWDHSVQHVFAIDTTQVKPDEIKSVKDLLQPRWKGRLLLSDPRVGDTRLAMVNVELTHGRDVVKQLLVDQQPVFSRDPRQITQAVIRGEYPVVLGARVEVLQDFVAQGVGKNVQYLDLADADFLPRVCAFAFNRAPHPNAAKLFLNWILTKQGQEILTKDNNFNSARSDVAPVDRSTYARPVKEYRVAQQEEIYPQIDAVAKYLDELMASR
jgi:iron(III) transport system substrate-binding protein